MSMEMSRAPFGDLSNVASYHANPATPAMSEATSQGVSQASSGKAKARELGEKTFSDFKQRRLRFRQAYFLHSVTQTMCPQVC